MSGAQSDGAVGPPVLAQLFDCDESAIRVLARKGIVVKAGHGKYLVGQSVRNYVRHLREIAAGRGGEEKQLALTQERARCAKEQADSLSIRNALLRGELIEVVAVERKWSAAFSTLRSGMLAIVSELPSLLAHLTRHDVDTIDRAIRDALNRVADELGDRR